MQIGELIRQAAFRYGDDIALVDDERSMSFRELDRATDRVGHGLLARGLKPGDRVGVLLPQSIGSVVVYYALAKAGLVRVALNPRETAADHEYKLDDTGSIALLREAGDGLRLEHTLTVEELRQMEQREDLGPCTHNRRMDEVFRLAFTGGTTGKPKAVTLTTSGELAELSHLLIDVLPDIRRGDTMLHGAPVTHGSGAFLLPHLVRGARNYILPRFDPARFLEVAEREKATATFLVPTMIAMLLDQPGVAERELAFRRLVYGAAPIAPSLLKRGMETFGRVFVQIYGQAEAPLCITCLQPEDHDREGAAGRPYMMVAAKVVNEQGETQPPGKPGEVMARGDHVMAGYWNRPEATADTLTEDGWLRTGDIGYFDEDGFLYLVDRKNDMIISGGFNVYPREVEDVLMSHPNVAEAAVVGLPDEKWGDRVHAVVSLRDKGVATSEDEILARCQSQLAGYKRPRGVSILDEVPKSPVGKLLRRAAREKVMETATNSETDG